MELFHTQLVVPIYVGPYCTLINLGGGRWTLAISSQYLS